MINLLYLFILLFVISATVYLVSMDRDPNPMKRALWTFGQLLGGMFVLALVVYLLTK